VDGGHLAGKPETTVPNFSILSFTSLAGLDEQAPCKQTALYPGRSNVIRVPSEKSSRFLRIPLNMAGEARYLGCTRADLPRLDRLSVNAMSNCGLSSPYAAEIALDSRATDSQHSPFSPAP